MSMPAGDSDPLLMCPFLQLTDTKSQDRQLTLLNYITHVVERVYPHIVSFYEDLDIDEACKGNTKRHAIL